MPSRSRAFSGPKLFFDKPQGITGIGQFNAAPQITHPVGFNVSDEHIGSPYLL